MMIRMSVTLSVVIPAYNAAEWLPRSVPRVATEISRAKFSKAEIIIVDDGSSDDTVAVAESLRLRYPIRVISQPNSGRFLARAAGVEVARYDYILFIDTRVFIGKSALRHITEHLDIVRDTLVWTSHVVIDKKGNIYARFWEALTFISWRKYFANPRDCSYGIKDFDYYPKGTTCFFVPTDIILEANDWFKKNTKNTKASNDDTLLIRRIAENHTINLSPKFFCIYHARTNLKQYSKHVYHRGKVFVDGFLRRDGNRFFWPLVIFLILSVIVPIYLLFFPQFVLGALLLLVGAWVLEFLVALCLRVPPKDAISLFILSPLFAALYGLGIWSAVFDIYSHINRANH